jgi:hypothetical protein
MSVRRIAFWLSVFFIVDGAVYLSLVIAVMLNGGLPPPEPYSTYISIVTYLAVPLMPLLWVAIHQATPPASRFFTLGSLMLLTVFVTLTSINRYNALTVVRQATGMGKTSGLDWFLPYDWPSIMAAIEEQAWGAYFGLACLVLAPRFRAGRLERAIFWTLVICGVFSLASVLAQILNNSPVGAIGIIAWGPGLMLFFVLLAAWFRRPPGAVSGD